MKFSLDQLQKLHTFPSKYEFTCQFDSDDIARVNGIIDIETVNVNLTIHRIEFEVYQFTYQIKGLMILECVLTLEPVNWLIDTEFNETYGPVETDEIIKIEKNTIDVEKAIWGFLIASIPIRVVHENAYEILASRNIILNEEFPDDDV